MMLVECQPPSKSVETNVSVTPRCTLHQERGEETLRWEGSLRGQLGQPGCLGRVHLMFLKPAVAVPRAAPMSWQGVWGQEIVAQNHLF